MTDGLQPLKTGVISAIATSIACCVDRTSPSYVPRCLGCETSDPCRCANCEAGYLLVPILVLLSASVSDSEGANGNRSDFFPSWQAFSSLGSRHMCAPACLFSSPGTPDDETAGLEHRQALEAGTVNESMVFRRSHCTACRLDRPGECAACEAGYALATASSSCEELCLVDNAITGPNALFVRNCASCARSEGNTRCSRCRAGYLLVHDGRACIPECLAAAYTGGEHGVANCRACSPQDTALCVSCRVGFVLDRQRNVCIQECIHTMSRSVVEHCEECLLIRVTPQVGGGPPLQSVHAVNASATVMPARAPHGKGIGGATVYSACIRCQDGYLLQYGGESCLPAAIANSVYEPQLLTGGQGAASALQATIGTPADEEPSSTTGLPEIDSPAGTQGRSGSPANVESSARRDTSRAAATQDGHRSPGNATAANNSAEPLSFSRGEHAGDPSDSGVAATIPDSAEAPNRSVFRQISGASGAHPEFREDTATPDVTTAYIVNWVERENSQRIPNCLVADPDTPVLCASCTPKFSLDVSHVSCLPALTPLELLAIVLATLLIATLLGWLAWKGIKCGIMNRVDGLQGKLPSQRRQYYTLQQARLCVNLTHPPSQSDQDSSDQA